MTIKSDPITHRKSLLKDPVTAFTVEYPEASSQQINYLKDLYAHYLSGKEQQKEIRDQSQQLSRKIGEAKRSSSPIAPLKQQMQEISIRSKALAEESKTIEDQILNMLEPVQQQKGKEQQISSDFTPRIYPGVKNDYRDINISLLGTEQQEWNNYVNENPATSIYHRAEWRELIQKTFNQHGHYFLARDTNNQIVGILPLVRLKSFLFGDFLVSMPYFNYGGAVANHPLIEQQLMTAANAFAEQQGSSHIEYRDDISRPDMPARKDKVNMLLALPCTEEALWQNFTPKLRAQIKRPQREDPEVLFGSEDLLDDFYSVFARNMRDLGTPVYSKAFFRNILNTFPKQSRILVIRWHGKTVAAAFLIGHKNTLEIPWASTLREINHLSMNMLMYWEVLRFAIQEKYQYFDFGRSSIDSGTYRFKQQWGAKPKSLFWHYWLPKENEIPALNPSNPKYAVMINVWQRLPLFLTKLIGPMIVKNLP